MSGSKNGRQPSDAALSSVGRRARRAALGRGDGGLPRAGAFADARPGASKPARSGMAEGAAAFDHAERHRVWADRQLPDPESGQPRRMRVNLAESPLLLLARRRDAKGRPFLGPELVAAGERLREDFELAQMGPSVTQNWDRFLRPGSTSAWPGSHEADRKARTVLPRHCASLAPGWAIEVLRVCARRARNDRTPSGLVGALGQVVLKLALERLARHYDDRYGPAPR